MLNLLNKLVESDIDFPVKELDTKIWDKNGNIYTLKPSVKNQILDVLSKYKDIYLLDIVSVDQNNNKNVHITGSLGTNQWESDSDLDTHLVVSKESNYYNDELFLEQVKDWFDENVFTIEGHPVEVYIQSNQPQEYLASACYNIFSEKWLKGPKIVPIDYDPYEDYSDIFTEIRSCVKDADLLFGELKRDIVDYETIKSAITKMPNEVKKELLEKSKSKLQEIENDIKELYVTRKKLVNARKLASEPKSDKQSVNDKSLKKMWDRKNAIFKWVAKYQYMRVIKELESLLDDGGLENNDVKKAKKIVGGIE